MAVQYSDKAVYSLSLHWVVREDGATLFIAVKTLGETGVVQEEISVRRHQHHGCIVAIHIGM